MIYLIAFVVLGLVCLYIILSLNKTDDQVDYLTSSDLHNVWLFEQQTKAIKDLEENLRLVYEYLGVKKEVFPEETLLVDEYDCCADEEWEDVLSEKDWGKKFEKMKNKKKV